ncbi:hypothetical protein E1A91_A11G227100v1 [Gossypium mustelinum]|uniref:Uncharacterized protein n=1 Tax=Gossypium mustelinum TaxID=34275 RepID=A0A5D2X9P2_GOSMU|nr:hypothetical protein E1A91_A11G227100v1 [Gossypium mustelinum]
MWLSVEHDISRRSATSNDRLSRGSIHRLSSSTAAITASGASSTQARSSIYLLYLVLFWK